MDRPLQNLALLASQVGETPVAAIIHVTDGWNQVLASSGISVTGLQKELDRVYGDGLSLLRDSRDERAMSTIAIPLGGAQNGYYTSVPIRGSDERISGMVLLMDKSARKISAAQLEELRVLGSVAGTCIELERQARETHQPASEREQKAVVLRESLEPKARSAVCAKEVICTFNERGEFCDVSESARSVWGYSPQELVGRNYVQYVHPEDRERTMRDMENLGKGASFVDYRNRYVCKNGDVVYVVWSAAWVEEDQVYYCIARDETERHQAETALRDRERRSTELLDSIPQILWIANANGEIEYVNERAVEFSGKEYDSLLSQGWLDIVHPDDVARTVELWSKCVRAMETCSLEYRMRNANGEYRWVLAQARPIKDVDGRLIKWAGASSDIDEQKQFESRLKQQAMLLEMASDAVVVNQANGTVSYWNRGAEQTYGYSKEAAVGRMFQDLVGRSEAQTHAFAIVRREGEWKGELQHQRKDGHEITVSCSWTCPFDTAGNPQPILCINTDVTEQKKLQTQFLRAQRLESIGTLAGGIAHDLNNVLSPILMSAEVLKMDSRDAKDEELLDMITTSAERGANLVRQVLSFARGVEGARTLVDVRRLIEGVAQIAEDTFPKNITTRCSVDGDLPPIMGDPTQLHQVLLNLCVNARDAMESGGTLTLSAGLIVFDEHYASMEMDAQPGPHVAVHVEDTGMGIPLQNLERIFEPFFTTKEVGKGTGLGLSTALGIVKSHRGFFRVYSEEGRGTKFSIFFPAESGSAEKCTLEAVHEWLKGNGQLILLVDDEETVREVTRTMLERNGYRVIDAADGIDGVASYAKRAGEIAVVLTDIMMPLMDGIAMSRILKKINPDVEIIAASGLSATENAAKVLQAGIQHCLPKPYTAETLLKALREAIEKRDPASAMSESRRN